MLVDVERTKADELLALFVQMQEGEGVEIMKRHSKGIYTEVGHNLHNLLDDSWRNSRFEYGEEALKEMIEREKNGTYIPPYGVVDSVEQFIEKFGKLLEEDAKYEYVVGLTQVLKSESPPDGGWRWHKWGEYYGTQQPTREYIYDEPVITEVWCFSVEKRLTKTEDT